MYDSRARMLLLMSMRTSRRPMTAVSLFVTIIVERRLASSMRRCAVYALRSMAAMRKTVLVRAMVVVAARWRRFVRRSHAMAGPVAKASAARVAGRRRAANDGPVRSKRCDMERV